MNDLRSPMEDRPYRPNERSPRLAQDDEVMSTSEYYRTKFDTIRQSRWFPLASVFAAVLVFSGFISYAYKQGSQSGVNATTPVVEAGNTDYKEKPADPGGMDVPFQDAVVFDELQNKGDTPGEDKIESLLPPPEQPVAAGATETKPVEETATVKEEIKTEEVKAEEPAAKEVAAAATTETTEVAPAPEAKPLVEEKPKADTAPVKKETGEVQELAAPVKTVEAPKPVVEAKPAPAPVVAPTPAPAPVAAPAPAPVAKAAPVAAGTYRVQLGAFRDEAAARAAWAKFQKDYSPSLSGVSPEFARADLGAKGVFYRVQGVNLSKNSADEICRSISSRGGSCMVVR